MSYSFKNYESLAGEDVELLTLTGQEIAGEIVAVEDAGYYLRVSQEGGQEYFVPRATVLLIAARSRKVG